MACAALTNRLRSTRSIFALVRLDRPQVFLKVLVNDYLFLGPAEHGGRLCDDFVKTQGLHLVPVGVGETEQLGGKVGAPSDVLLDPFEPLAKR